MKSLNKLFIALALLVGVSSCDVLEFDPTDRYNEATGWASKANVDKYIAGQYGSLEVYGQFGSHSFGTAAFNTDGLTDMLKYSSNTAGYGTPNLLLFVDGQISSSSNVLSYWSDCYTRIRKVNEFLDGLKNDCKVLSAEETLAYEAEARFLRGYLYYLLVRAHHSVILYDYLGDWQNPLKARSSEADCWQFVYDDLEFAYTNLSESKRTDGRVDKATAAALMSRAMLFAQRWDDVITAAKRVMEIGYSLDPSYAAVFNSTYTARSVETIFQVDYANENYCHTWDSKNCPSGDDPNATAWCPGPTQEMISEYETADSKTVNWNSLPSGTDLTALYKSLEPRFQASVLYNGSSWKGRTIETFVGGKDGFKAYNDEGAPKTTVTGYYMRKYLDEKNTEFVTANSTQSFVAFRYAEVLLNYAEALVKSSTQKNIATAMGYVNMVRDRAGLKAVSAATDDAAMKAIKHERKIELAFEGFHYWDLKRWGDAAKELGNVQFHAIKITKSTSGLAYEFPTCDGGQNRLFPDKYYSLPIPDSEITTNTLCLQLDEWK
ncbi:MAG: RagB/SusD family nutrient uptake outer membrane protein [Muribaculaceae bacterium]|nr:RagB/SusD family nutrient uptake outer membrane protein [Muribaculaceae bacterium]